MDRFWNEKILLGTVRVTKVPLYSVTDKEQEMFAKADAFYDRQCGILCIDCTTYRFGGGEVEPKFVALNKKSRILESHKCFEDACRRTISVADEWFKQAKHLFEQASAK